MTPTPRIKHMLPTLATPMPSAHHHLGNHYLNLTLMQLELRSIYLLPLCKTFVALFCFCISKKSLLILSNDNVLKTHS
jgi:hypothetical protein